MFEPIYPPKLKLKVLDVITSLSQADQGNFVFALPIYLDDDGWRACGDLEGDTAVFVPCSESFKAVTPIGSEEEWAEYGSLVFLKGRTPDLHGVPLPICMIAEHNPQFDVYRRLKSTQRQTHLEEPMRNMLRRIHHVLREGNDL